MVGLQHPTHLDQAYVNLTDGDISTCQSMHMQQNTRCIAHRLGPPGGLATSVAPDPGLCHRWRFLKVSKHASAAKHTWLTGLAGLHHLTQLDLAYVTLTGRDTSKC